MASTNIADDDESQPLAYSPQLASNVAYFRKPPRDYKFGAIFSTVLCFFPLGVIGIYFSLKVQSSYRAGDVGTAIKASKITRLLIQATVIIGSLLWFGGLLGIIYVANQH